MNRFGSTTALAPIIQGHRVSIRIFDFAMLPVRTLIQKAPRLGGKGVRWNLNGRNDNHLFVTNGVYFYRVELAISRLLGKILVLRWKLFPYIIAIVLLSLSASLIALSQLQSSSSDGGLAGGPMRMGFGARGLAMGNAMTAVISGDVQSYYIRHSFHSNPIRQLMRIWSSLFG